MTVDYIIVGGGSAGSVLANRLSARSSSMVLLCEAGQDTPPGKVPKEILDSYSGTAYLDNRFLWSNLKVSTEVVSHNNDPTAPKPRLRKYEQARVLGGGSSINGQMANRGAPTDFDEWHARGATGWRWENVLPYFKKLERDLDFDDQWHGQDGPIPVRRVPEHQWPGHARALAATFKRAGYKYVADQNGFFEDGYFPVTISNAEEKRVSVAIGYLTEEVRKRPNLIITTQTQVTELLFEGLQCVGVKAMVDGKSQEFRGREIILSSGAIHSPAHFAARRYRAGRPSARSWHPGSASAVRCRSAIDGSSLDCARRFSKARCASDEQGDAPAPLPWLALYLEYWRRAARRHVRRRGHEDILARSRRADRHVHPVRQQDFLRDGAGAPTHPQSI
jgi:choline dehydrogenase-like flavoprotein